MDSVLKELLEYLIKHESREYLNTQEIQAVELNSELLGVSLQELMEHAGKAVADYCLQTYTSESFLIFAGSGNNGGDALVAARHLLDAKKNVQIYIVSRSGKVKGKQAVNAFKRLKDAHNPSITYITNPEHLSKLDLNAKIKEFIVLDGIFGTGLKTKITGITREVISLYPHAKAVLSIDVPSGMNADTGEWLGPQFTPSIIITFQKQKHALKQFPNAIIRVIDIGIPPEAEFLVLEGHLKTFWPRRDPYSHKGNNGRVMIIGGSIEYTGAPVLSSLSSLRAGTDNLRLVVPASIRQIVSSYSPNFIVFPTPGDYLDEEFIEPIVEKVIERHDVVVVGMGISNNPKALAFTRTLVRKLRGSPVKIVLDADGIRAFRGHLDELKDTHAIITPHKRELAWLLNIPRIPKELHERAQFIKEKAKELGITILLKGKYDLISDGTTILVNPSGHAGMTVGGTGDVLAGLTGFTTSMISSSLYAAALAAFVIGRAGELAAQIYGNSLLATDLPDCIGKYLTQQGVNG